MSEEQEHVVGVRHSLAHLLAATVAELYPGTKYTIGPAIENGFYEDLDIPAQVSEEDLPKIEAAMKKKLKSWTTFERKEVSADEAREVFSWNPYKLELIDEFAKDGKQLTLYTSGEFVDLCRGGHVDNANEINPDAFRLTKLSGAYWRGDHSKQQLQRIYGVAFETPEELKAYLVMMEEAKKRDHRKLGQDLDLFVFSELVGAGLPLWTPRGTVMRNEINRFVQDIRDEFDYQEVAIPHITKKDLYIKSGHWDKFKEELFKINTREGHEFAMKPMNCPHHTQIYAAHPHSYRELPIRYRETTMVYRDEQTGELNGLSRVRSITQDDAHVFCRESQIKEEVETMWEIVERFYGALDISLKVRLSRHNPDEMGKYLGSEEKWQSAESQLQAVIEARGVQAIDGMGDAAFYGPKIDFIGIDALGREIQVSTIQVDFGQPEGFNLTCVDESGIDERIVMIHSAVSGSLERCLTLLIEHYAGKFPVWLAPEQLRIITINQDSSIVDFANTMADQAKKLRVRVVVDADNVSVGKKIRKAELMKVPYTVVIGPKEVETGELTPRIRQDMEVDVEHPPRTPYELVKTVANEAATRVRKTSL